MTVYVLMLNDTPAGVTSDLVAAREFAANNSTNSPFVSARYYKFTLDKRV